MTQNIFNCIWDNTITIATELLVLSSSHHCLPTACSLAEVPCEGDVPFLLRKIQVRFRELLYTVRGSFQPHHQPLSLLKASTSNHYQISLGIPVSNHQPTFCSLYETVISFSFPEPIVHNHNLDVQWSMTNEGKVIRFHNEQERVCTYNIKLMRVSATIVAVEKAINLHILSVCL